MVLYTDSPCLYIIYKIQNTYNIFMYRCIYLYTHTSIICKKYHEPQDHLGPSRLANNTRSIIPSSIPTTSMLLHFPHLLVNHFRTSLCHFLEDFWPRKFPKISGSFGEQIPWFKIRARSWWVELSPIEKHAQVVFGFHFLKDRGDFFF